MKLTSFIIGLVLTIPAISQAQVAFIGGINRSDFNQADASSKTLLAIGTSVEKHITDRFVLCLQPSFVQKGADVESAEIRLDYLDLPVLVKYNLNIFNTYLLAGAQGGINVSANAKSEEGSHDVSDITKNLDFGPAFGLGVNFDFLGLPLMAEAQYFHGVINVNKESGLEVNNRDIRLHLGVVVF